MEIIGGTMVERFVFSDEQIATTTARRAAGRFAEAFALTRSLARLVIIGFCFGAVAGFNASHAAEEQSTNIQVGDLVLAIPAGMEARYVPEQAGRSTRFDYSKAGPAQPDIRRVDGISIKLHRLWPTSDQSTNEVVSIYADGRAAKVDLFCQSVSRSGLNLDRTQALQLDRDFYVFAGLSASDLIYRARSLRTFGGPVTARRSIVTARHKPARGQASPIEQFSFQIALSESVRLRMQFTIDQVPRDQWADFFGKLSATLRSWVRSPAPSTFKWYHEQASSCE